MEKNNQDGIALILVLWVMVLLTAIVSEFAFSMRTEVNITRNFKEGQEAYYAALAGIEQAKSEILSAEDIMYLDEKGVLILNKDSKTPERTGSIGKASYTYEIIDEERKLNLNSASADQLRQIFKNSGVEGAELDTIIDSISDWKDPDNLHRINGAEEDYYQSLSPPYSCKDGAFDTLAELLLVKGMSSEIMYGSKKNKEQKNAAQYLTVHSAGMININTADRAVLEIMYGSATAENILTQRSTSHLLMPTAGWVVKSSYFTIISTGASKGLKRSVLAVVQKIDAKTIRVLYWNDYAAQHVETKGRELLK